MNILYKLNIVLNNCENKLIIAQLCNKFIIRNKIDAHSYIIENGIFFFNITPLKIKKFRRRLKRRRKFFRYYKILRRRLFLKRFKLNCLTKTKPKNNNNYIELLEYQKVHLLKVAKKNSLLKEKEKIERIKYKKKQLKLNKTNVKKNSTKTLNSIKKNKNIKKAKFNSFLLDSILKLNSNKRSFTGFFFKGNSGIFKRKRKKKTKLIFFFLKKKLISFLKQRLFLTKLILNLKRNRTPFSGFCKRIVRGGFICKTSFFSIKGFISRKSVILPFKKQFKLSHFYKLLRILKITNSFLNIRTLFLIYAFNKKLKFTNFFLIIRRYKLRIIFPLYIYCFKKTIYKYKRKKGKKLYRRRRKRRRLFRKKKRKKRILKIKRRFFYRTYRIVFISKLKKKKASSLVIKKAKYYRCYTRVKLRFFFQWLNKLKRRRRFFRKKKHFRWRKRKIKFKKKRKRKLLFKKRYVKVSLETSLLKQKKTQKNKLKIKKLTVKPQNIFQKKNEILVKQNKFTNQRKPFINRYKSKRFKKNNYANKKR